MHRGCTTNLLYSAEYEDCENYARMAFCGSNQMKNIVNAGYLMRLLSKETCREAFGVTDVLTDGLTFLQVQVQVQEPEGPAKGEVLLWSTYS